MENNLMELWSLLSITAPGLFPSQTRFRDYYARPIEKGRDGELLGQLRRRIKPLVKRRTKSRWPPTCPLSRSRCWRWNCIRGTGRSTSGSCNGSGRRSSA
jgi:hypothetical protein